MENSNSCEAISCAAERVRFCVDDILADGRSLDFRHPFLPETLTRTQTLTFLSPSERLTVNHVRSHGYLCMFRLIEEIIVPFVSQYLCEETGEDEWRTEALAGFVQDEYKHIQLFRRFHDSFQRGFGTPCAVFGPSEEVIRQILAHHPLAVAMIVLHAEWMTQRHYLESVRFDHTLEPRFASLLRHHWLEEAQHAQLDTLVVNELSRTCSEGERRRAVGDYYRIIMLLDDVLSEQVQLDLEAFVMATGRALCSTAQERMTEAQLAALRWTFLGSGMTHPRVLTALEQILPNSSQTVRRLAANFL